MLRSPVKRGLLLATAVAAAATAPLAGAVTSPTITSPATIRITDVQRSYQMVDAHGSPGRLGDVEIIDEALYNAAITKRAIGRGKLSCTFLDDRARNCSGTFFLPKGTLMIAGVISTRLFFQLAVVGGTGLYANARGTLTVTSLSLRPRRELLLFRLVP